VRARLTRAVAGAVHRGADVEGRQARRTGQLGCWLGPAEPLGQLGAALGLKAALGVLDDFDVIGELSVRQIHDDEA
jgi:hypothetical protein